MVRPLNLLGLFFVAALSVSLSGSAWSAPLAKKAPRKVAVLKPKQGLPTVAAVTALAVPAAVVAAAVVTPTDSSPPAAHPVPANPYAAHPPLIASVDPRKAIGQLIYDVKMALPRLPTEGQSILPVIKTVHPTGDKPLVVVTFKCPTEVIGIVPPPTKLLHDAVNAGMDTLNKSNLLAFNMQQVCQ